MALNAAKSADTVEALAAAIGAPVAAVAASIDEAHAAAAERRTDAVGRSWAGVSPPVGPYRALRVKGALYHTQGGLQIDAGARVVRADGSPLPNLFAGGGAARGVSEPSSWGLSAGHGAVRGRHPGSPRRSLRRSPCAQALAIGRSGLPGARFAATVAWFK